MEHQAWERVLADKDAELDRLHDQLDDMADRAVEERRVRAHLHEVWGDLLLADLELLQVSIDLVHVVVAVLRV